jgi:hypothetical protein
VVNELHFIQSVDGKYAVLRDATADVEVAHVNLEHQLGEMLAFAIVDAISEMAASGGVVDKTDVN